MNESLVVVVSITSKPDSIATVQEALLAIMAPTRAESGCMRYDLYTNNKLAGGFTIIGEFVDLAAIELHDSAPYLKGLIKTISGLADIQVARLSELND